MDGVHTLLYLGLHAGSVTNYFNSNFKGSIWCLYFQCGRENIEIRNNRHFL